MNTYDLARGLHILAVIAWMAGMLFLPRLFAYDAEQNAKPEPLRSEMQGLLRTWQTRLLRIIINPAMVLTFVFVLSVLGATSKIENSRVAGLVIGLSLTLVHLLGIGFTGTSVNPARSLGPALFAGGDALRCVWVFLLAPLVGAAIAAFIWMFLNGGEHKEDEAAE